MASPQYSREEPSSREEPPSPLPAPYEDPWRRLATDLAAVVATARLKAQELWRLNGEGTLAAPAFWPRGLAPLFWPLLLALGLVLVVGLALRLPGGWEGPPENPAPPPPSTLEIPEDTGSAGGPSADPRPMDQGGGSTGLASPWPWRQQGPGGDQAAGASGGPEMFDAGAAPAINPTAGAPSQTARGDSSPLGSGDGAGAGSAADGAAESAAESTAVPASLPLAELVGADPPAWVLALEQRPAEGLLRLRLAGGYGALPFAERRTLAERWLERTRELGYERLELVDPAGRLLGRPARVGSGMILLDAPSPPP